MKISLSGASQVLLVIAGILLLSLGLGVGLNQSFVGDPHEQPFSYSEKDGRRQFKPVAGSEGLANSPFQAIGLEELKKAVQKKDVVVIDGRSEKDYENGHIPGAYSLSVADFQKRLPEVASQISKDDRIAVYCGGGECSLSRRLAELLYEKGYSRVRIYYGGYSEWFLGSNPVIKGKERP
jgi:rhodanese-related sulfurtransferase